MSLRKKFVSFLMTKKDEIPTVEVPLDRDLHQELTWLSEETGVSFPDILRLLPKFILEETPEPVDELKKMKDEWNALLKHNVPKAKSGVVSNDGTVRIC